MISDLENSKYDCKLSLSESEMSTEKDISEKYEDETILYNPTTPPNSPPIYEESTTQTNISL